MSLIPYYSELGLFRKALKSSDVAMTHNCFNLRAAQVKAKCLQALGKSLEAKDMLASLLGQVLQSESSSAVVVVDVYILRELNDLLQTLSGADSSPVVVVVATPSLPPTSTDCINVIAVVAIVVVVVVTIIIKIIVIIISNNLLLL